MERTLRTHIEDLELILRQLNDEVMEQDDLRVRNALEARVRAANQALEHYRAALAAGDPTPDTRVAAERGLKEPYQAPAARR